MYTAKQVANVIINFCHDNHNPITNLKLQKLLYFIQGEFYRYHHKRLIDDDFYAWQLGPVIPDVYYEYAMYSSSLLPRQNDDQRIDENTVKSIKDILQNYAHISTWGLVEISHGQDPWKYNYEIFGDKSIIPFDSIANYYRENN